MARDLDVAYDFGAEDDYFAQEFIRHLLQNQPQQEDEEFIYLNPQHDDHLNIFDEIS